MSESQNNSNLPSQESKYSFLWAAWARNQKWREALARKTAYRAADMPDDEMEINNIKTGISGLAATGIALAAGLPTAGLGAMLLWNQLFGAKPPATAAPAPPTATNTVTKQTLEVGAPQIVDPPKQ